MIILFSLTILLVSRSAFSMYKESATQRSIVRSVEDINFASAAIMDELSRMAHSEGEEQYFALLEVVKADDDSTMSEKELDDYFRKGYANRIIKQLGENSAQICETLSEVVHRSGKADVSISDRGVTGIDKETDDSGNITSLRIRNVTIECSDPIAGSRTDTISYNIMFPDVAFHAGNDELFRYSLVAQKGIYITGKTSSVIGDIYAGKHADAERRDAEIEYGETGTYGGINILATQLGVRADRIISQGDININGSFVIVEQLNMPVSCFAQRINEIKGFSKNTMYSLDGDFIPTYRMEEDAFGEYHDAISLIDTSLNGLGEISIYYDSNNDGLYTGKYRKLISQADVDITSDFTGLVVTPGNVIIHNDVNFEGTILCGDRIYIMGNNNIVANESVIRTIFASEFSDDNNIKASNYIRGLNRAGFSDPEYYVVPYR